MNEAEPLFVVIMEEARIVEEPFINNPLSVFPVAVI